MNEKKEKVMTTDKPSQAEGDVGDDNETASTPPGTEEADGTPVENPSGG